MLLREHGLAVADDVELRFGAADRARVETGCPELGRETRGPFVVPVSDRAVKDLDGHRARLYSRVMAIAECRTVDLWSDLDPVMMLHSRCVNRPKRLWTMLEFGVRDRAGREGRVSAEPALAEDQPYRS